MARFPGHNLSLRFFPSAGRVLLPLLLLVSLVAAVPAARAAQRRASADQNEFARPAESELQTGTDLTREGRFAQAIPHLLAARGHVADDYAASFNLALCYVATRQPQLAIPILEELQSEKSGTAAVWNLSAQAYVANAQADKAFQALQRAARITPDDARLYSYISDACVAAKNNALGLKVVDLGLRNVPRSARLHYERAVFLTALDRFSEAKNDFRLASQYGQDTDIGYLSTAHEAFIQGDTAECIRVAREAVSKGKDDYILLDLYADALFRTGVYRGSPGLAEAERIAEKSVAERPDYAPSRITLGKLYLIDRRFDDCVAQLAIAQQLDPQNPAIYANLASAYRQKGDRRHAQEALAVLARLNQRQVTAIRDSGTKTGEHRGNISASHN